MENMLYELIFELVIYGGLFFLIFFASKYIDSKTDFSKFKKRRTHIRY
jgi:hypothetical protein